jgi:23S rRNA pseudouridine2605 synthase
MPSAKCPIITAKCGKQSHELCFNQEMTDAELQQARTEKWHLDGHPVRTLEDGRAFLESVGFSLLYPLRPSLLVPTFVGAWVGADDRLPTWQHSFSDPRARDAQDLMVRLLRDRAVFEANLFDENNAFLVSASAFPFFYALVGERNPRQAPKAGSRSEYSQLACDAFEVIRREGPISKQKLGEKLGGSLSGPALDRGLAELWARLRITRVDYNAEEGASWDVLYRWAPEAVREGISFSVGEALSALISKYLECVVAADQTELEAFFGNFVPRSRVKEAIKALLAARELSFVHVGSRSLVQVAPPRVPFSAVPKDRKSNSGSETLPNRN